MTRNDTALKSLPSNLQDTVVEWVFYLISEAPKELKTSGVGPLVPWVVDHLIDLIYPEDDEFESYTNEQELVVLQDWDTSLHEGELYQLVNTICNNVYDTRHKDAQDTPIKSRKATDKQLQIIRELQQDTPDISFDGCFSLLSTWQAHAIISGLLVISEVVRCTGRRELKPGDLRRSIRNFIEGNRDRYPYRR